MTYHYLNQYDHKWHGKCWCGEQFASEDEHETLCHYHQLCREWKKRKPLTEAEADRLEGEAIMAAIEWQRDCDERAFVAKYN